MRTFIRSLLVTGALAVVSFPLAAARADAVDPTQEASQKPAKSEADSLVQLIDSALGHVNLRDDQSKKLQAVGDKLDEEVANVDEAKRAFLMSLASQVESGSIDAKALEPKIVDLADAAARAEPEMHSALETVHDTLDPDQRKLFVKTVRDELKDRESKVSTKSRIDTLTKELNLSDEQQKKITAILDDDEHQVRRDVEHARLDLILAAFPGKHFEMDRLIPANFARHHARKMAYHIVADAKAINEDLTPDQRAKAAKMIRDKAGQPVHGGTQPTTQMPSGGSAPGATEPVGSTSQALWGGARFGGGYRAGGYSVSTGYASASGYRVSSGYGYSSGYSTGYFF